jgi:uncharacterized membrane protein
MDTKQGVYLAVIIAIVVALVTALLLNERLVVPRRLYGKKIEERMVDAAPIIPEPAEPTTAAVKASGAGGITPLVDRDVRLARVAMGISTDFRTLA